MAADLFCGAGGTSTGLLQAAKTLGREVDLLAVNHWPTAVNTHTLNHPGVRHLCETLDSVDPRKVVPGGKLDLLVASPECTHHSNARGGKPMSDQSRATAWHIPRWADSLRVDNILIENVKEFANWGPIGDDGRPIPHMKGRLFIKLLETLDCLGYTVQHRVLNAANHGDATSRQRLFIQARKRDVINWPKPSHLAPSDISAYEGALPWRTAREIIDWSLEGRSIYGRKKPLTEKTMQRIYAGLRKYSRLPFIVGAGGPTGQSWPQAVDNPIGTIIGQNHRALIEPYVVVFRNNVDAQSVDRPLGTLCANGQHYGLAEPYLIKFYEGSNAASLDVPLPTITANYEHLGLAQPYLVEFHGGEKADERTRTIDTPLPTQGCSNLFGVAQPFLIKYYGNEEGGVDIDYPLATVTGKDTFALVEPELLTNKMHPIGYLDIRFRMLQPHELAAAMGFPKEYEFTGTREEKVKQIGNSVAVNLARELCLSIFRSEFAA
jgi:DNA (cytosine-5)-methyltransferase 1